MICQTSRYLDKFLSNSLSFESSKEFEPLFITCLKVLSSPKAKDRYRLFIAT